VTVLLQEKEGFTELAEVRGPLNVYMFVCQYVVFTLCLHCMLILYNR
jgi:hypothetical protein